MRDDEYTLFGPEDDGIGGGLERREFLKLVGGGIVFVFSVGEGLALQEGRRGGGYPEDYNAYLLIGGDGRVTCFSGKIEMGQGIVTSLGQMLAEELDVRLDAVDMVMGDTDLCPYDAGTFGSRSTKYFGPPLRQAGAEARSVLVRLAAAELKVPEGQLETKDGAVFVRANPARKISYADLAKGKKLEVRLESKPAIKPHSKHTISGKATDRTDGRAKVTGAAKFAGDVRLPGMLYGAIVRPPAHGAKLQSADTSAAEKVKGVRILRDGDLVAALHESPDVAARARDLIQAEFDPSPSRLDNATIFEHLRNSNPRADVVTEAGSLDQGRSLSAKTFEATYLNHYVAHAPSEPHTALVKIEGDRATVWASTQAPFRAQSEVARTLGLPGPNVRVLTPFVGCGFGGKNQGDQIVEAARLAKLCGKPVQVAWSRKEEFFLDTFRPAAVIAVKSGLNAANEIVYWEYDNYYAGNRSSEPIYNIPHHRVRSLGGWSGGGSPHPFGVGAWRGPGSNSNVFAMESHTDLMAAASGMDPLSFRLKNLKDERMIRVVHAAAEKFGKPFAKAPSGKGYGVACTNYLGTYVVTMAEVRVDEKAGEVRVLRVVCAQDTGEVINPEGARMQIEGCITMGLGYALKEEVRFRNGRVLDENFDTYEIPRFSWRPAIETVLVDNPEMAPQGCGEPAITPMGAVVANAIHDAVGARLFVLPMTPARIKEAMES